MIPSASIDSFACVVGDVDGEAGSIAHFDELWSTAAPGTDFSAMGSSRYRKMSGPIEQYVIDCAQRTLIKHGTRPEAVDRVVFSMMDATLGLLGPNFVAEVLDSLGSVNCLPSVLSFQQCCSSISALTYCRQMLLDDDVENVLLIALDFRIEDSERVRSFALFGDAVTSCMVSRDQSRGMRLLSSCVGMDHDGMLGRDSFLSRQKVARETFAKALREAGVQADDVVRVFPTNLFVPLTQFNAAAAGIQKPKLHFDETLAEFGHCGNCDWLMNLDDYRRSIGMEAGEVFVALATAPGFFACAVLSALSPRKGPELVVDDLTGPAIAEFLEEHIEEMKEVTPPGSKHALELDELRRPEVTFWTLLDDDEVIACGAIKRLDGDHGEIKSMRVAPSHRQRGVASALLRHLLFEARRSGLSRLSLETGSFEFFEPARRLYGSHGFEVCEPFGEYVPDPNSTFMTKQL
jgi:3-oxoacyl-[acyl-carrier-protein] synthase III/GNAT superfamily N-acetyltransferase